MYPNCQGFAPYYYPPYRAPAGDVTPAPSVTVGWPKLLFAAGLFGVMAWMYSAEVKTQYPTKK